MRKLLAGIRDLFSPPRYPPAYVPVRCHTVLSNDRRHYMTDILQRAER
jgi:hypothetical protein